MQKDPIKSNEFDRTEITHGVLRVALLLMLSFISLEAVYLGVKAGVDHLRFLYLGSVLLFSCVHLTVIRRLARALTLTLVLLTIWGLVHLRIFTPALYRFSHVNVHEAFNDPFYPDVEVVIMTFPGSPRGNSVENWVKPLVDRYSFFTKYTVEQNTTSVTNLIDDDELSERVLTPILRSHIRGLLDILQRYSGTGHADWILYFEDDAIPLDTEGFAEIIQELRSVTCCDVIVLDYRSVMMDFLPGSVIGITGLMIRRSSLAHIIDRIVLGYRTVATPGEAIGVDWMIGYYIDRGELSGTCVPYILENESPSTLDWGRKGVKSVHVFLEKLIVFLITATWFCWVEWKHLHETRVRGQDYRLL